MVAPSIIGWSHSAFGRSEAPRPTMMAEVARDAITDLDLLDTRATAPAHALTDAGVGRRDTVLLIAADHAEVIVSFWGIIRAGAVAAPLSHGAGGDGMVEQRVTELHRSRLAAYTVPKEIHVVERIPVTACGKLARSRITDEYAHGRGSAR